MTIKEKPLIRAVERLGPLPNFLFRSPFFAGFFAAFMCAVFGGAFSFFWGFGFAASSGLELFWVIVAGAVPGLVLAGVTFLILGFTAPKEEEDRAVRMQFVRGGFAGIVFTLALMFSAWCAFGDWLAQTGPLTRAAR